MEAVYQDEYVRHVVFDQPLRIMLDGRIHKGVILLPGAPENEGK